MPNWSYNILNASDEVLKQIVNEEGEIDFNTVVPMPKELLATVSPSRDDTQEKKDASKNLIEKYGSDNWYDCRARIGELNGMESLMNHTPMSLEAETLYSHMVKELFISEQHGVIQRVS